MPGWRRELLPYRVRAANRRLERKRRRAAAAAASADAARDAVPDTPDVPRLLAELEGLEALLAEINREISQRLAEGTEGEGGLGRRIVAAIRGGNTRRKRLPGLRHLVRPGSS